MSQLSISQLVPPALLHAAGFALLHSLWQGAGLALLVALLLRALRGRAAVVRYRLAGLGLTLLVGLAALTFGYYYVASPVPTAGLASGALGLPLLARAASAAQFWAGAQPRPAGPPYLEPYLPVLVAAWLLGVGAMTGRLLLALGYVRRLRRHRAQAVPQVWQQCLARLSQRAGLARPVALVASALVPSPLVLGYFKPVILLPLSILSQLAPAELEMILAHELAHILRKDYLFNFLQSVAETVFFYHPAVWFLSAVLHAERENCCDDLATQLAGSPQQLARALAALAELTLAPAAGPRLALAAAGPTGSLLSRVRRLATYRPARATGFWPASLVLLLAGLLLGGALRPIARPRGPARTTTRTCRARTTKSRPDDAPRTARPALAQSDEALQALFQAQLLADGLLPNPAHYTITLTNTRLAVDGRPQAPARLARYHQLYEAGTGYRMTPETSYYTEKEVVSQVVPALAALRSSVGEAARR
jgi:bla regulator protein BlaR1